ncbi:MAG TPA: hypothetical protein VLN74_15635, partial [Ilumatobacteraceae bacterium]|nr:hypothetical protein [Ilumatobacteraceae bacterium]
MIQQAGLGGARRPSLEVSPRRRRRGVPFAWPVHGRRHDRAASAIRIRIALAARSCRRPWTGQA